MRKRSLAAGAAAAAVAVLTAVPTTTASAAAPARDATGTAMCATSQLTASLGGSDAAAGSAFRTLVLTNHSATTCHLTGYPGVSLLDRAGHQLGDPATRRPLSYSPVVLHPGASASDTIRTVNHQGTCLPASAEIRVYPPGNRASLVFPGAITNCHHELEITPLIAGTGGNPSGGGTPVPTASPTHGSQNGTSGGSTSGSGRQVTAVPSGAPDTGLAARPSGGSDTPVLAGVGAGVLLLGGAAFTAARRRRARG